MTEFLRRLWALATEGTPAAQPQGNASPMLKSPNAFFASLRTSGLLGGLDQSEVDGINNILTACSNAGFPMAFTAYCLATAFHETAGTMQPIRERGSRAYLTTMYDVAGKNPQRARLMGNTAMGDGVLFCGRGLVQLTWKANYLKAGKKLGVDLVANPDLAMRPDIAAQIMIVGMREGWFTGRDLADDLPVSGPATRQQFVLSRDIINGHDKEQHIADEAVVFQQALQIGAWQ